MKTNLHTTRFCNGQVILPKGDGLKPIIWMLIAGIALAVLVALVAGCQFDKLSVDKGRLEPWGAKMPPESSVLLP